jgi:uncharacterized protein YndB with AHSA1/START domain
MPRKGKSSALFVANFFAPLLPKVMYSCCQLLCIPVYQKLCSCNYRLQAEILDQWVAPKPWKSKTKYMDFKVGGKRFYAMVSPEGQERWAIQEYTSITPKTNFKMHNAFADENGNPELPGSEWDYTFSEQDGKTKVNITIYNESLARLEKMIEMGFTEGFKMSMNNLENLLATLSEK